MNREMEAMFPNGIRALIVDDGARFIKSSSMLLSLLNFKVASCGSPTSALKFFSRDKNKDVDVVLINAEKAATCGFDFRGIVETDLSIPVIYFLSRDHVATGDEADELLRTLRDATYVLTSPLQANDVCELWRVIGWRKCYLENKAKRWADDGRRVVPTAAVQAFLASGGSSSRSTAVDGERVEDEDRIHYKVVGAGRRSGRKRKSRCNTIAADSSETTVVAGDQTAKTKGKMNVTGRDDVPSQQQPATTQKAALPLVPQQQQQHQHQQPAGATTIEAIATPPRWNQNQPAAGNVVVFGNIAPATGVANNMATTVGGGNQQQQQNFCPPLMFGPFPYQGPRPPVLKPAIFMPPRRYSGTESIGAGATVGASAAATGAGEHGNATTSLAPTLNLGTEPDGHDDVLAAMMAMYTDESNPPVAKAATTAALYSGNSSALMAPQPQPQQIDHGVAANRAEAMDALNTNYSTAAAMAPPPQHVGHGSVAPKHAAAGQEVLNNGNNFGTYSTSLMAPNQVLNKASNVNELAMAGGAFFSNANDEASFTAPQDVTMAAAADGDQLAPGALDAISASLMGSLGPGAAMDGKNPGLEEFEAMFSPGQYDNTMFPLEALLGLDDAPVYEADADYQQGGAAGGSAGDAAGTSLIGGADDNLDVLNDYLFMESTGDFNTGRE